MITIRQLIKAMEKEMKEEDRCVWICLQCGKNYNNDSGCLTCGLCDACLEANRL